MPAALSGIMFTVPRHLPGVPGEDPVSAGLRLLPMTGGPPAAASPAARAAARSASLHGTSSVMLTCAAVTVLAALASLRYLPGRATPGPAAAATRDRAPASRTRR